MASSNQKSISGSHSIPFHSRDDAFQDMTAFTPPPESWLRNYRNQKKENHSVRKEEEKRNRLAHYVPEANQLEDPCKQYIETSEIEVKSNKSLGTDDHFKSAVCSKNLLKVCEKLMTRKEFSGTSSSIDSAVDVEDDFDAELSLMNEKSRMEFYRSKHGNRRNSKSLPSSPKMDRKNQVPVTHNPYFTITKTADSKPESSLAFLTSLFGITAAKPSNAQANLTQKYEVEANMAQKSNDSGGSEQSSSQKMKPKPHQLREMNIFSPTSM